MQNPQVLQEEDKEKRGCQKSRFVKEHCASQKHGLSVAAGEGSAHAFKRRDHFRKSSLVADVANALRLEGGDLFHESLIHACGSVDTEEHPDKRTF